MFLFRVDTVLDPWNFDLKVGGGEVVTMPDGSNIKKCIVDVLHRLQKKLLSDDEGDTKSFRNIIQVKVDSVAIVAACDLTYKFCFRFTL